MYSTLHVGSLFIHMHNSYVYVHRSQLVGIAHSADRGICAKRAILLNRRLIQLIMNSFVALPSTIVWYIVFICIQ